MANATTPVTPYCSLEEFRRRLRVAASGPEREPGVYHALRQQLLLSAGERLDAGWNEAALLLDVAFRQQPVRTLERLAALRERRRAEGNPAAFDAFWHELQELLHPCALNDHGYFPSLASRDATRVWAEIAVFVRKLAGHGYSAFLNSGTLLGAIREGGLIAHDDDIDLAVLLHAADAAGAAVEWRALRAWLQANWLIDREFEKQGRTHCKLGKAGGASVDLFPAWIDRGRLHIWPHTDGNLAGDALLPLALRSIAGIDLPVPADPEAVLASNYGPRWAVPDPTFRFDWSAAARRFVPFVDAFRSP